MPNYLNQIESDLYKLNSMIDGSGEVVEMVAEIKEKYEKAAAFDESLKGFKELERLYEKVRKVSKRNQEKSEVYKEVLSHVIREMESNLGESGELNELREQRIYPTVF